MHEQSNWDSCSTAQGRSKAHPTVITMHNHSEICTIVHPAVDSFMEAQAVMLVTDPIVIDMVRVLL